MIKFLLIALCIAAAPLAARADHHDETKKAAPAGAESMKDSAHTHDAHMGHGDKKGGKKHHCAECNMDMKSGGEMKAHMKEHHGMEGYCMKCSMGFKTKDEAKAHHKSAHAGKMKGAKKGTKEPKQEALP